MSEIEPFTPFSVPQLLSHCAPCSLSYCLYLLGIEATQRELARAAGQPIKTFFAGMEPPKIRLAAAAYKVGATFLEVRNKAHGPQFAARLKRHLQRGLPAMVLVWDFEHWVAVVGHLDGKFVVADPDDNAEQFRRWTERKLLNECWNDDGEDDPDDPPQYYAILLKRRDCKPARWKLTDDWVKLCERGNEQDLTAMAADLQDIAGRAGGFFTGRDGVTLASVLRCHESMITEQVAHWVGDAVTQGQLRGLFRDYLITADAMQLQVPRRVNHAILVAQMATILTVWACLDDL